MSRWGEITVECDTPSCHGCEIFTAEQLLGWAVRQLLELGGWKLQGERWICPACVVEQPSVIWRGDAAQR